MNTDTTDLLDLHRGELCECGHPIGSHQHDIVDTGTDYYVAVTTCEQCPPGDGCTLFSPQAPAGSCDDIGEPW